METQPVTLGYWALRGFGERVRLILEYTNLPYTQEIFTAEAPEKWFNDRKPELIKKNPAINLPFLIDGDKVISESNTLMIYVAHRSGKKELLGRNFDEQLNITTVEGVCKGLHQEFLKLSYGGHGKASYEEAHKEFIEKFRPSLVKLQGLLGEKDWIAGEITWIDFVVTEFLQQLFLQTPGFKEEYPALLKYQQRLFSLPELQNYFKSSRWQEFPVNYVTAQWGGKK